MTRLPSRRWWIRLLLGVVWTPIAAEIFLRIFAPGMMLPPFIEAGPHGVRTNIPSITYFHRTPEYTVEFRTNAKGMRADKEFSIEKPDGVRRIAILGDSFGMGFGVNLEESSLHTLQLILEKELDCPVEVLNFSVMGFGPSEELVVFREEALQFDPDLVIQYFYVNDPSDDMRTKLFKLDDDELVAFNSSYNPPGGIRDFLFSYRLIREFPLSDPIYRWIAGETHLYTLVRRHSILFTESLLGTIRQALALKKSAPKQPDAPAIIRPTSVPDGLKTGEWLTLRILDQMRIESNAAGAEFMILSIPSRQARNEFTDGFPYTNELEFNVVSPLTRFQAAGGEMIYWERSAGHWTPLGCRLAAESLAERILQDGLMERCEPRP